MRADDQRDSKAHIEETKRMRDYSRKKLIEYITAERAGRKRTIAEDMGDASMATGRGPPPSPGAPGYVGMVVDDINNKRQPHAFRMDSPRGKRGGPRPGPKPDTPPYHSVNPVHEPPQQTPQEVYSGGARVNKLKTQAH
jgi:hypothetical protein